MESQQVMYEMERFHGVLPTREVLPYTFDGYGEPCPGYWRARFHLGDLNIYTNFRMGLS